MASSSIKRGTRFIKEISEEFGLKFHRHDSHYTYVTEMFKFPEFFIRFWQRKILICIYKASNCNYPYICEIIKNSEKYKIKQLIHEALSYIK